ncbi:DNA-directed RNA polymerase subunit omega [candidate division TA06 bacterium]|uniref:DNA-directed RNA polymerase subunit omega n=1 Tax=candidate division TA06 bacterium TaxID=2250710 RepID=A0A523UYQ8_UNCT6|nr:MAG: DNA-directed RNA polymerase subunit omega [candidate division TA06 bacterium]
MVGELNVDVTGGLREVLSRVKMGIEINRYEFSVAVAKRAREIHELTADSERKTRQRSLRAALEDIVTGAARIEKEK